jgi:hypothetical protein
MVFFMNPINFSELTLFAQELQRFLSPIALQEIAKQVGFVKRSSKYQADELIALCVWLSQDVASTSITQLCSRLEVRRERTILDHKVRHNKRKCLTNNGLKAHSKCVVRSV